MSPADHPVGPVEMMLIGLPGNRFDGAIPPTLSRLVEAGTVRLIDLVLVHKDLDGRVTATPIEGSVDPELRRAAGSLLTAEDVEIAGEELAPDSAAALVLWENSWAARLSAEIFDAGGAVLAHDRVPAESVVAAFATAPMPDRLTA
ncbi:MAG TPA: DUF6325 family protein [Acidimicrobiales bacterium]